LQQRKTAWSYIILDVLWNSSEGESWFSLKQPMPDPELFYKIRLPFQKHEPAVKPPNHPALVPPAANQPVNYPLSVSRIGERKSGPAKTLSISVVSSTVRAIGPSTAKLFQPAAQQ